MFIEAHSAIFSDIDGIILFLVVSQAALLPTFLGQLYVTVHMRDEIAMFYPAMLTLYEDALEKKRLIQVAVESGCAEFAQCVQMKCFSFGQAVAISHGMANRVKIITGDSTTFEFLNRLCPELALDARIIKFDSIEIAQNPIIEGVA